MVANSYLNRYEPIGIYTIGNYTIRRLLSQRYFNKLLPSPKKSLYGSLFDPPNFVRRVTLLAFIVQGQHRKICWASQRDF